MSRETYKVVRFFRDKEPPYHQRTIFTGLTLEQAQEHCNDPETSWKTCKKAHNKRRTREHGAWFDGWYKE